MLKRTVVSIAMLALFGGCGTAKNFTSGLEKPVKAASSAAAIAVDAEGVVLTSSVLGMVKDAPTDPAEIVCVPSIGPDVAARDLGLFPDALEIVKDVAEKPQDLSYSGYIRQFRKNTGNSQRASSMAEEAVKRDKEAREARNRCRALFRADISAKPPLQSIAPAATGQAPFAVFLALDQFVKTLLGTAESMQREAVVRQTVQALIDPLNKSYSALAAGVNADFGPRVVYSDTSSEASKENTTLLGATITLLRWHVAQEYMAIWAKLEECRPASKENPPPDGGKPIIRHSDCLGDPVARANAADLVNAVRSYRKLSTLNSTEILVALRTGIDKTAAAANGTSIPDLTDGLVAIADSISTLSDVYGKYQKAKSGD